MSERLKKWSTRVALFVIEQIIAVVVGKVKPQLGGGTYIMWHILCCPFRSTVGNVDKEGQKTGIIRRLTHSHHISGASPHIFWWILERVLGRGHSQALHQSHSAIGK